MTTNHDALREAQCRKTCDVCWDETGSEWPCAKEAARRKVALAASKPAENDALPCCGYQDATAIKWNPFNGAVQCHNCGQTYAASKPEQQAQAEPEVVAYIQTNKDGSDLIWDWDYDEELDGTLYSYEPLITLQSHREALAPLQAAQQRLHRIEAAMKIKGGDEHYPTEWAYLQACKLIDEQKEALAAKDAALDVALEALESYSKSAYVKHQHPKRFAAGNRAITKIKEAR